MELRIGTASARSSVFRGLPGPPQSRALGSIRLSLQKRLASASGRSWDSPPDGCVVPLARVPLLESGLSAPEPFQASDPFAKTKPLRGSGLHSSLQYGRLSSITLWDRNRFLQRANLVSGLSGLAVRSPAPLRSEKARRMHGVLGVSVPIQQSGTCCVLGPRKGEGNSRIRTSSAFLEFPRKG